MNENEHPLKGCRHDWLIDKCIDLIGFDPQV